MNDFRSDLLGSERTSALLQAKYEEKVKALIDMKLTRKQRIAWAVCAIGSCFVAWLFAAATAIALDAINKEGSVPWPAPVMTGLASGFFVIVAVYSATAAARARHNLLKGPPALASLLWGVSVLFLGLAVVAAELMPRAAGTELVLCMVAVMVAASMYRIIEYVKQAELRTREKLIEIEFRLAELAEPKPG